MTMWSGRSPGNATEVVLEKDPAERGRDAGAELLSVLMPDELRCLREIGFFTAKRTLYGYMPMRLIHVYDPEIVRGLEGRGLIIRVRSAEVRGCGKPSGYALTDLGSRAAEDLDA